LGALAQSALRFFFRATLFKHDANKGGFAAGFYSEPVFSVRYGPSALFF
jgi:hypothetical protein